MPRILFLNKAPPYQSSGSEKVVWEAGKHLAEHGWDVHYLSPLDLDERDPPERQNVTFHNVSTPSSYLAGRVAYFIRGIGAYRRLVRELDPDLIYDNASPLMFVYAHLADPDRTVTKVHGVNGLGAFTNKPHLPTKIGTFLGDQLYRFKDGRRILTVSESTKERLRGLVRNHDDDITVIRNGIDVDSFEYRFSPDGPVVCLCILTPRKNVASLLRAWRSLERRGVDRDLLILGDGPSRDRLESLARELGLRQVTFAGYVEEDKKRRLLRDASCHVLPTRLEGLGLSNLEAMASGCAVVSTDTYGVREYLDHGQNGLVVPVDDPNALADAIERLLDDPELAESLARAGCRTVEQGFRIEAAVEREREVLEGFLDTSDRD
jgi:glycosyltransferase involved in cell wall biosynthesis